MDSKNTNATPTLIHTMTNLPLSNLEYWERLIRDERNSSSIQHSQYITKIWIDLCSWDGYIREKAIRNLEEAAPNGLFFALLLRRLNDWVPEVRKAARNKIQMIAKLSNSADVVDALFLILSTWSSWKRIETLDTQALFDVIAIKEIAQLLKYKITFDASGPLTSIFSQMSRTTILDDSLRDIAKNAVQPSIRAKAYRCQFNNKMSWCEGREWKWTYRLAGEGRFKPIVVERALSINYSFLETLKNASIDRSSIVRQVAAELLIRELEQLGDNALILANLFLSDLSRSVSERGEFALKKLKEKP